MKQIFCRLWLVLLLFLLPAAFSAAEETFLPPAVTWSVETEAGTISVQSDVLEDEAWLFLPASADLSALTLRVDTSMGGLRWQGTGSTSAAFNNGSTVDWLAVAEQPEAGVYSASLFSDEQDAPILRLNLMRSAYLRSVHIYSDDPVNQGREWLEDCPLHEKSTTATLVMLRPDGSVSANEWIEKLRGRGNSTWEKAIHKKPYQIKLDRKRDLLETGDEDEKNKKWVLLSNEAVLTTDADLSMLRNQIALDLGREFGLSETSRCEQVDLYYDSVYRGTYLLCEKVEVKAGRLELEDYDDLIESMADREKIDLDALPMGEAVNRYGQALHFTQGVPEPEDIASAGYLIELERGTYDDGTVSDPAWFSLSNGQNFALKNPSWGGVRAVTYASELMEDAYRALTNYGFDPETGTPVSQWMDVESFTRSFLINEITQNKDAYASTSTNFVIKPNERKLYAGPIWDFDLVTNKVQALRDNSEWARAFYRTTVFQTAAKRIYPQELYPLVKDILLGGQSGHALKPLSQYEEELTPSWNMNYHRFFAQGFTNAVSSVELSSYVKRLRSFYEAQSEWLLKEIQQWSEDAPAQEVDVLLDSPMGDIARYMTAAVVDEQYSGLHVSDLALECLRPATQEEYGLWQATITLSPKPNCQLAEALTVRVNDETVTCNRLSDTAAQVTFTFENPLYRPAVYEGVDYGLVFHLDFFADYYPELFEECGGTLEGALQYYCETGMDEGLMCSDYFSPSSIPQNNARLEARYQDDWRAYILLFLADGKTDALDRFVPYQIEDD